MFVNPCQKITMFVSEFFRVGKLFGNIRGKERDKSKDRSRKTPTK